MDLSPKPIAIDKQEELALALDGYTIDPFSTDYCFHHHVNKLLEEVFQIKSSKEHELWKDLKWTNLPEIKKIKKLEAQEKLGILHASFLRIESIGELWSKSESIEPIWHLTELELSC